MSSPSAVWASPLSSSLSSSSSSSAKLRVLVVGAARSGKTSLITLLFGAQLTAAHASASASESTDAALSRARNDTDDDHDDDHDDHAHAADDDAHAHAGCAQQQQQQQRTQRRRVRCAAVEYTHAQSPVSVVELTVARRMLRDDDERVSVPVGRSASAAQRSSTVLQPEELMAAAHASSTTASSNENDDDGGDHDDDDGRDARAGDDAAHASARASAAASSATAADDEEDPYEMDAADEAVELARVDPFHALVLVVTDVRVLMSGAVRRILRRVRGPAAAGYRLPVAVVVPKADTLPKRVVHGFFVLVRRLQIDHLVGIFAVSCFPERKCLRTLSALCPAGCAAGADAQAPPSDGMAASDGAQGAIGRYVCRRCHLSFSACARQCGDPHVLFDAVGDAWRCAHCGVRWQVAVVASQHAKLSRALMRAIMEAHAADASAAPGRPPVAPRGTVAVPSAVPRDSALATLASSASSAASQWSESSDAAARAVDELQREHAAHSARGRSASEEAADALAHGRSDAKEYGSVVATGLGMAVWGASRAVAASASGLSAASAALLRGAGSVTSASVGALGRALRWRKGDAANAAGSDSGQPDEAAEHS